MGVPFDTDASASPLQPHERLELFLARMLASQRPASRLNVIEGGKSVTPDVHIDSTEYATLFQLYTTTPKLQERFAKTALDVRFTFTKEGRSWHLAVLDLEHAQENGLAHVGTYYAPKYRRDIRSMFTKPALHWRNPGLVELYERLLLDPNIAIGHRPASLWISPVLLTERVGDNVKHYLAPRTFNVFYEWHKRDPTGAA